MAGRGPAPGPLASQTKSGRPAGRPSRGGPGHVRPFTRPAVAKDGDPRTTDDQTVPPRPREPARRASINRSSSRWPVCLASMQCIWIVSEGWLARSPQPHRPGLVRAGVICWMDRGPPLVVRSGENCCWDSGEHAAVPTACLLGRVVWFVAG